MSSILQNVNILHDGKLANPRRPFLNTNVAQGKGSRWMNKVTPVSLGYPLSVFNKKNYSPRKAKGTQTETDQHQEELVEGGRTSTVTTNRRTDSVRCSECTTCTNRKTMVDH